MTAAEARRELWLATGLLLVGGAVVLGGVEATWVSVTAPHQLTVVTLAHQVKGAALVPGVQALALVGLAAVVAVLAVHGWARRLVGALVTTSGAVCAVQVWRHLGPDRLFEAAAAHAGVCFSSCPSQADVSRFSLHHGPQAMALVGALVLVAAGVLVVVRGASWPGLGSAYQAPGAPPEPPVTDKGVWDALDRGDDPTA